MSNYQLLSLSSSPAAQVLMKDMSIDPLLYNLQASLPSMTKDKIELPIPSNYDFSKKVDFQLPRYGLLKSLVFRSRIVLENTTKLEKNAGFVFIKSARLMSHSREIASINYIQNLSAVAELEKSSKDTIQAGALSSFWGVAATANTSGTFNMYTPLMFAELTTGMGNLIDLSFVEPITLQLEFCSSAEFTAAGTAAALGEDDDNGTVDAALLVYYYSLDEASLRKYEDQQYDLVRPLSTLSYSTYEESIVQFTPSAPTLKIYAVHAGVSVKFNVPNLVTCTRIAVYKNGRIGDFQQIVAAEFFMNGRSVYKYNGNESAIENAMFGVGGFATNRGVIATQVAADGANENILTHYWAVQPENPNCFSGAVSGKNISNFSVVLSVLPYAAAADGVAETFNVLVSHSHINILSFSGNSGKIAVSMSL